MIFLINFFKPIQGAISVAEAVAMYYTILNNCKLKFQYAADLGSNFGKSSCIASAALSDAGIEGEFHLVDPIYNQKNPDLSETIGTHGHNPYYDWPDFCERTLSHVSKFSRMKPILNPVPSVRFLETCPMLGYVFIDSDDHNDITIQKELSIVDKKLLVGGILGFHDFGNQCVAPKEAAYKLIESGSYELLPIDWDYVLSIADSLGGEEGNQSWHMTHLKNPIYVGFLRRIK